jgi:predicted metal-binding transcription factor (methanogenesis marker protein 9)
MKLAEIQKKAQNLGLDYGKFKKDELIRNIQLKEGNNSCFKAMKTSCDQYGCCWRDGCKPK